MGQSQLPGKGLQGGAKSLPLQDSSGALRGLPLGQFRGAEGPSTGTVQGQSVFRTRTASEVSEVAESRSKIISIKATLIFK